MSSLEGHPKGLYLVFMTSTAEHFSYYGMRTIFIPFLTQALLFDKEAATSIYGSYTGLVYLTPLIGGYTAGKYWSIRRSVFQEAVMIAVGQLLMFMNASSLNNADLAHWLMYGRLGFMILGNGCFKPTVSSLVGQLYEPGDKRLNAVYTIFHMGVGVGSFVAPLICGLLEDIGSPQDFKWGFLASGIMTLFTIVLFETQKSKYLFSSSGEPVGIVSDARREKKKDKAEHISHPKMDKRTRVRNIITITALTVALITFFSYTFSDDWISVGIFTVRAIFPVLILLDGSLTKVERSRIFVIYIVAFFIIFFWAAYEQVGVSLTLFASEQTDHSIFGWEIPASQFQSFNPLFAMIPAYIMPGIWGFPNRRNMGPASPVKQAIGLLLLSLGCLFICFGVKDAIPGVKVSMIWLTGLYFIHTMGGIALSPIGLSIVNRSSPLRFTSLMMGTWYLSTATTNKFTDILDGLYPEDGRVKSILGYQITTMYNFFILFIIMSGVASLVLFLLSKELQRMMHGVE